MHRSDSARRPSDEGCATNHCLKWGHLFPNGVCRTQSTLRRKKEGKKGRMEIVDPDKFSSELLGF